MAKTKQYSFTGDQIATILHALRILQELRRNEFIGGCWHEEVERARCGSINNSCEHFDGWNPLTDEQIDTLCESINPLDTTTNDRPTATVFLNPSESDKAYIHAAREMIEGGVHFDADEIEIDDNPLTSPGVDHGAWVAAWIWVTNSDADLCEECGGSLDDGEGFNGYCGECADEKEAKN